MMPLDALGRFLKERKPYLLDSSMVARLTRKETDELFDALDATVALLREAEERLSNCLNCAERPSPYALKFCATLRLVLGEKETP